MKRSILILSLVLFFTSVLPVLLFDGCTDIEKKETVTGKSIYYCPMHPQIQSDKPGVCPICQMDLVLRDNDGNTAMDNNSLQLNDRKVMLAQVATSEIKSENIVKTVTAYSYLDFAEQNKKTITARFGGRIEKLFVDRTGEYVKKGTPLFEIYSPDLIQAQNDYLIASGNLKQLGSDDNGTPLLNASAEKLRLMGITDEQINDIRNSGIVKMSMTYYSPFSGTVIDKKVQEGVYVNEGSTIYEVADMSVLWGISEIFADDLGFIKEGSSVKLRLQSYPGEEFTGKVDLIYPVVNAESRTVKIRSVFVNRNGVLKPNMYGETVFTVDLGKGLLVPQDAVISTGKMDMVWVEPVKGEFQMRQVKLGYKIRDKYQVLSGLKAGEIVASEGGYLIDSESQLRGGTTTGHEGHLSPDGSDKNNHQGSQSFNKMDKKESEISSNQGIFNEYCPVLGNKVNKNIPAVDYNGKKIGFCCSGCDKDFLSDPEKYMKNISSDGKKFIKKS